MNEKTLMTNTQNYSNQMKILFQLIYCLSVLDYVESYGSLSENFLSLPC